MEPTVAIAAPRIPHPKPRKEVHVEQRGSHHKFHRRLSITRTAENGVHTVGGEEEWEEKYPDQSVFHAIRYDRLVGSEYLEECLQAGTEYQGTDYGQHEFETENLLDDLLRPFRVIGPITLGDQGNATGSDNLVEHLDHPKEGVEQGGRGNCRGVDEPDPQHIHQIVDRLQKHPDHRGEGEPENLGIHRTCCKVFKVFRGHGGLLYHAQCVSTS